MTKPKQPRPRAMEWGIWIPFTSGKVAASALKKVNGLSAHFKASGEALAALEAGGGQ